MSAAMSGTPRSASKLGDQIGGAGHKMARGEPLEGAAGGRFWCPDPQWAFGESFECPGGDALDAGIFLPFDRYRRNIENLDLV